MDDHLDVIEDVRVPEDGAQRAIAVGSARNRRRRALVTIGCGVLVIAGVLGVLAARGSGDASVSTAGTVPTPPPLLGPALLDLPPDALAAQPVIPEGWRTINRGLASFSVPADYRATSAWVNSGCGGLTTGVPPSDAELASTLFMCSGATTMMQVASLPTRCTLCNSQTVNGLRVDMPPHATCYGCAIRFELPELGLRIDMPPNASPFEQILSTVTPSPVARALAAGPTADVRSWREEAEREVSLRVPATWATAEVEQGSPNVASCGGSPLVGHSETVLRGQGGGEPQCALAPPATLAPAPMDGVWLRSYAGSEEDRQSVDPIELGNARVLVDRYSGADHVYVEVAAQGGKTLVAVAINTDPTIARTVLRTMTVDGHHLGSPRPTPASPAPTPSTVSPAATNPATASTSTPPTATPPSTTTVPGSSTTSHSSSTSTATISPTGDVARPMPRDLRADLVNVGASVDSAPGGMLGSLAAVPSCGVAPAEPFEDTPEGRCFLAAMVAHEEAVVVGVEGVGERNLVVHVLHTRADRSVELFADRLHEPFGAPEWAFTSCFARPVDLRDPPSLTGLCQS